MTKVAGLLREEDPPVSSAHVIEAVRLAETLAAMRGRPLAGLAETTDAVRAVMCDGSDVPLALIHDRLVVGDVLGEVPADAPRGAAAAGPRPASSAALRLKPEALERELELDLRKETDAGAQPAAAPAAAARRRLGRAGRARAAARAPSGRPGGCAGSRSCPCGSPRPGSGARPCSSAATAKAEADAVAARRASPRSPALAERCLLAELPDALPVVMRVARRPGRARRRRRPSRRGPARAGPLRALRRRARHGRRRARRGRRRASPSGSASGCRRPASGWTPTAPPRCAAMWTRCTAPSGCSAQPRRERPADVRHRGLRGPVGAAVLRGGSAGAGRDA